MTRRSLLSVARRLGVVLAAAAIFGQALALALHRPALAALPAHLLLDPAAWCGPAPAGPVLPGLPQHDTEHCTLCPAFTATALPPSENAALHHVPDPERRPLAQPAAAPATAYFSPLQPRAPPSVA